MFRAALLVLALLVAGIACFVWLGGGERGGRAFVGDEEPAAVAERAVPELAPPERPAANAAPSDGEPTRIALGAATLDERTRSAQDEGITIAGRVLDEQGAPVEGLQVCAFDPRGSGSGFESSTAADETDDDGRFELTGLTRQSWSVRTDQGILASSAEALVDATQGDLRELVLRVVRCVCIEGIVEWPDGSPAAKGFLELRWGEVSTRITFVDGRFEACVTPGQTYALAATAATDDARGTAHLEGVRAGERGLRLVLDAQPRFGVRGMVVDLHGQPLRRFIAVASDGDGRTSSSRSGRDGRFELAGLSEGEWDIEIRAKGFLAPPQRVLIGPMVPELRFVVSDAGRIRGVVLDPFGQPVARAKVLGSGDSDSSDIRGRFELDVRSSPVRIHAERQGSAPSEELALSVADGEILQDVVLRLRAPCRLEGRVLDADGLPVDGAHLFLRSGTTRSNSSTDSDGRFVFEELPEGSSRVTAVVEWSEFARAALARAEVALGPGATAELELRLERTDPVHVRGSFVSATRASLQFSTRTGHNIVNSDADGHFETTLDCPGPCKCAVRGAAGEVRVLDFVVPDVEEYELVLDLDAMRRVESFDEFDY